MGRWLRSCWRKREERCVNPQPPARSVVPREGENPVNADAWVDPRVTRVRAAGLESYLLAHGWKRVPHPRKQLMVFEGPLDDDGEPFILVAPSSERLRDFTSGIVRVIESLYVIEDRHAVEILNDI